MEIILRAYRDSGTNDWERDSVTEAIASAIGLEHRGFPGAQEILVDGTTLFPAGTSAQEWAQEWDVRARGATP